MCGIAGFWTPGGLDRDSPEVLRRMTDAIRHRGPDGEGYWLDPEAGIALGHRRLSILDLSDAGSQPMVSGSGRYVATYNGEIYNWRELRREEEGHGARFRSHSDTEVFLALCDRVGIAEAVRRSSGMFAMGIWDRAERQLVLARDRVGEKPLYYGWVGGRFLFGSELSAFRAHPDFCGSVDREAIRSYLKFGYIPAPLSVFTGVHKLIPGTIATFGPQPGHHPIVDPFWSWPELVEGVRTTFSSRTPAQRKDELKDTLSGVIADEMVSDVPVGAFLSGGIDSSLIVALMQAQSTRPVRTFTIGFNERGFDEAASARDVAKHLGTEHTEVYLTAGDALDIIPTMASVYDEPFADSSQLPTYLVARLARESVSVSLSGDGGDEVFGGYNRYTAIPRLLAVRKRFGPTAIDVAAAAVLAAKPRTWDFLLPRANSRSGWRMTGDQLTKVAQVIRMGTLEGMYTQANTLNDGVEALFPDASRRDIAYPRLPDGMENDPVGAMMLADGTGYLPNDVLVKVDRATMAVGLESRAPFLHDKVLAFAAGLPTGERMTSEGNGKAVLRQLLGEFIPQSMVDRPKSGFAIPLANWLGSELLPWAGDLAASRVVDELGLDRTELHRMLHNRRRGRSVEPAALWTALMLVAWAIDGK